MIMVFKIVLRTAGTGTLKVVRYRQVSPSVFTINQPRLPMTNPSLKSMTDIPRATSP